MQYEKYDFQPKNKDRPPAEFITLPNIIKGKVGSGGLSEEILNKAQQLLDDHKIDFTPTALEQLDLLMDEIKKSQSYLNQEVEDISSVIEPLLEPCRELFAHADMFHFPLVTEISKGVIRFLSQVHQIDVGVLEILAAYHTTIRAIVLNKIYGDGGAQGAALVQTLNDAFDRYYNKNS